ncbi:MAG: hypothetical protein ABL891_08425 [Burkholderiales bacterium]
MLWETNELLLLLIFLAGFLVAMEAGFRLGLRYSAVSGEPEKDHNSALQAAILGLLALLLGFTFLMAVSRFDTRKALVLDEANAIGTTFLRSKLLPAAQRDAAPGLLRSYVAARLTFHNASNDRARLDAANAEASRIEEQLWALSKAAAAQDERSVTTGLFIQSLNEVIDTREKRQVALDNHVPEAVIYLLLAVSLAALGLLAYGCGLERKRRLPSNALFALLIALVLTTILDIDRPRRGLIEVSQDSMIRLKATLEQGAR